MKTADEWADEMPDRYSADPEWVKKIQLDAMKEGMRREAKQNFEPSPRRPMETERDYVLRNINMYRKAILAVADQLTKKDLP